MTTIKLAGLSQALREIRDHVCAKCGAQAKGFSVRQRTPVYYCRKCLQSELSITRR